ncbi:hypothetical protein JCM3775_004208 [Rhodotorula graminis]
MHRRLPCLVRAACPSSATPSPPPPRRASTRAAQRSGSTAHSEGDHAAVPGPSRLPHTPTSALASSPELLPRRADNFLRADPTALEARTLVQQLRQRREGRAAHAAGPAGGRVGPAVSSSAGPKSASLAAAQLGTQGTGAGAASSTKGKARRPPATAVSQHDFASFPRFGSTSFAPAHLASADSLLAQPLPSTEPALYDFLRLAHTTHPGVPTSWLAWFHAHPRVAPLASTRTYRLLLHRASTTTDKALVRTLLSEMQERGLGLDDETRRVLLRAYLRGGDDERALEVVRGLRRSVAKGVVLEATKPRDLGEGAKGRGDVRVQWKGWAVRERDKRAEEERRAAAAAAAAVELVPRGTSKRRRQRPSAAAMAAAAAVHARVPPRGAALVPARPDSLSSSDIATLIECLGQERRHAEAYGLAETWLAANRPPAQGGRASSSSPPVQSHRVAAEYNSTALVLMNTLLKSLFYEKPSPSSVRTFIDTFLVKHSAPFPAVPLMPNVVTLRLLVSGCLGADDAWDRATALVDWLGYRFGLPPSDGRLTGRRRYFVPPTHVEGKRVGAAEPSLGVVSTSVAARDPVLVPPHAVVAPDVAVLLLRHAVDQHVRRTLGYKERARAIRRWWSGFDRRGSDVWGFWRTRQLEDRAKRVGLLRPKVKVSSRVVKEGEQ